jgi:hypothetical protein
LHFEQRARQRFRIERIGSGGDDQRAELRTRRSFSCFALSASTFSSESKSRGLRIYCLHRVVMRR